MRILIDKLAYSSTQRSITVAHPELEEYLNLFRHVISKLCKPSHNYEAVPLSDEMVNMINNQYDYFYNEVSEKDNRIYLLVKNIIAYIAPLIDDFNLLQDRYYIVIVNTAFISHSMYFTVQKTAQNALFMYVDNLNMDTIATLLYHKYKK